MSNILIPAASGVIEGVFVNGGGDSGVVISHPHPEYGGDMNNHVVMALEKAYQDSGYSTLRFNFRGTGRSRGDYDTYFDMCEDVEAAVNFMKGSGIRSIALAGYSFGAWVNTHADDPALSLTHQLLVSPPVSFMDFSDIGKLSSRFFIICGDRDEYADYASIEKYAALWRADLKKIAGCDHFYSGRVESLSEECIKFIR